ncbi:hypothetical protein [Pseudohongiella acticola]|uniref:hypothetical protein n=1 Tax=Pseudohongiella acticola TaxID=1524254 RepID=UPI0030EDF2BE
MKINLTTPYCGAASTDIRFSITPTLHRIVVQTTPYCGAVRLIFRLSLHRIVVTFIYLPSIGCRLVTFKRDQIMRAVNFVLGVNTN